MSGYLDQPAILQKANEILAHNSRYLSTASVTPIHHHGGAWPGHPSGGCEDGGCGFRQHRSATCSPQRRGRSMSHVSAEDYHEVMAQASKYRPKPYYGKGGLPPAPGPGLPPAGLTEAQHRPSYTGSTPHSAYGASPMPSAAPGFLGYRADRHVPLHVASTDATDVIDRDNFYQNQMKKLLTEIRQQANDLQRERQEGEKLRQELQERDAAVHDARSVARTAKQQLEEASTKRREVDAKLADAQRDCNTAHQARIGSEKQLNDVRSLAVSLEDQNRELRGYASQKESAMRHAAERELQQSRQHIESLEAQVQNLHDNLQARGVELADAERAAKNSSRDAAVLRAQLAVSGPSRLSTAEDSETALEADIARLSTMQEQREASSRSGERGGQVANGTSVEVITLQCVVEAQDRDLATLKERIAALQGEVERARELAAGESAGAAAATQRALLELDAQKQALERRAAEAEGSRTLLQAECAASRQDLARLQKEMESTASPRRQGGQVTVLNLTSAEPAFTRDGHSKPLSYADSGPQVAGSLSIGSAQSWRIEAGRSLPAAAGVEEGARLRAALEEARNLYAELEVSSGEHIRALQLQVRELQQQVSDQLQESNGSAAGQSSSRGRVEQLRRVVQQLQTHLRHARDIHGISMPLLDSDEGLLADFPEPSTEVDAAQVEADKQLHSEVQQKLEWLQGKLEEKEKCNADFKRTQQASADAAQARISDLEAQVESLGEALAASRTKLEGTLHSTSSNRDELAALYSTIEALRCEQRGLSEQLHQAQTQHVAAQQAEEAAGQELETTKQAVRQAQEQTGQHMEEVAEVRMRLATEEHTAATAQASATAVRQEAEAAWAEVSGLQMEVEGLRGQVEEAEERYQNVLRESGEGQAAVERQAADAASEAVFLQREVGVLKRKLEAAEQDARNAAASAAAAASGDLEGLQGQNTALREEVMDLRLRLEGASASAEEVTQLREREGKLQQELEDAQQTLSQSQAQAGDDSTWVWSQVHDLTAQVAALREQLAQSHASVEDLKSQLALAEAAGAPGKSTERDEDNQQLQLELAELQGDLAEAVRARDELSGRVSALQGQLAELQTALANEQARQEEGACAAADSHARERALEEELASVRGDLVEAQRSLVAAAEAPEELAGAVSDVVVRALIALRQGVADAFSTSHGVSQAAAASNDEWLLSEVATAVADMQRSSSGEGASDVIAAMQQDLEIMNNERETAQKSALEAEVEIAQFCDKLDKETEAREKAAATCEELRKQLQSATSTRDDLRTQLQLCRDELGRAKRSAPAAADSPETPQPRGLTIPPMNPAAAGSPEESRALRKALQDVTARAESLETDLARLEMDMPVIEKQREEAYASVAELQQQLKDLKLKGFDLDTKEAVQRIAAAESAAAKSSAATEAAVAARDAAVAQTQAAIKKHTQRIQELERELSKQPQPKQRAPLSMAPSHGAPGSPTKRGASKLKTPQPRSVVRSDTGTPLPTGSLRRDPDAESLKTLAAAELGPAAGALSDAQPAVAHSRLAVGTSAHNNSTSFDVAEETTLADMATFTPVLLTDRRAQHAAERRGLDENAEARGRDDPLAHLTPPGPLSSDTSESRPCSHSANGSLTAATTTRAVLPDADSVPLQGSPVQLADTASAPVFALPIAQSPLATGSASPAARAVGRSLEAGASIGGSKNPSGVGSQGSHVSEGPPRAQGAISPILEGEVMEFAEVHAMRHKAAKLTDSDISASMVQSVDVAMGSLAGFMDFGRMGSKSPVGESSSEGVTSSAQLLREASDVPERALSATPP